MLPAKLIIHCPLAFFKLQPLYYTLPPFMSILLVTFFCNVHRKMQSGKQQEVDVFKSNLVNAGWSLHNFLLLLLGRQPHSRNAISFAPSLCATILFRFNDKFIFSTIGKFRKETMNGKLRNYFQLLEMIQRCSFRLLQFKIINIIFFVLELLNKFVRHKLTAIATMNWGWTDAPWSTM